MIASGWISLILISGLPFFGKDPMQGARQPLAEYLLEVARSESTTLVFADSLLSGWYVSEFPDTTSFLDKLWHISRTVPVRFLFDSTGSVLIVSQKKSFPASLQITFRDENSMEPIEQAILYFEDSEYLIETDSSGIISLNRIPSGIYHLRIFRLGYHPKTLTVPVSPYLNSKQTVFLTRQDIESQIITINSMPGTLGISSFQTRNIPGQDSSGNSFEKAKNSSLFFYPEGIYESNIQSSSGSLSRIEEVGFILNGLNILGAWQFHDSPFSIPVISETMISSSLVRDDGFDVFTANGSTTIYDFKSDGFQPGLLLRSSIKDQVVRYTTKNKTFDGTFFYKKNQLGRDIETSVSPLKMSSQSGTGFGTIRFFPGNGHELTLNTLLNYDSFATQNRSEATIQGISSEKKTSAIWTNYNYTSSRTVFMQSLAGIQSYRSSGTFHFSDTGGLPETENRTIYQLTLKSTVNWNPSSKLLFSGGIDFNGYFFRINREISNGIASIASDLENDKMKNHNALGISFQSEWQTGASIFQIGNRLNILPIENQILTWDPRLALIHQVSKSLRMYFSGGHYTQTLSPEFVPYQLKSVNLQSYQIFHQTEWIHSEGFLAKVALYARHYHKPGQAWYYLPKHRFYLSPEPANQKLTHRQNIGGYFEISGNSDAMEWGGRQSIGQTEIEGAQDKYLGSTSATSLWYVINTGLHSFIKMNWHLTSGEIFFGPDSNIEGDYKALTDSEFRFRKLPTTSRLDIWYLKQVQVFFFELELFAGITNVMNQIGSDPSPAIIQFSGPTEKPVNIDRFSPTLFPRTLFVGLSLISGNN